MQERISKFKDDIVQLNQANKLDLSSVKNELNRYKAEVDGYKDAVATTKALYIDLQQQHFRLTADHDKLKQDVATNGDAKELTKEFEAILSERREKYEYTLGERDAEIADLKKTVESR